MSIEVNNLSQGTDANHQISDKDSIEIDIPKPKKDKKIMDDADPDHIY